MKRTNRFRKIRSNNETIEEKLQLLNEIPVNNTGGLYTIEPEFTYQPPDEPGEVTREVDFDQDDSAGDTTGLFDDDGTILTIEPPITEESPDRSFILGPMASMWYAWGNFTQIGYIRESDRRMVNLGRITGQLKNWDGVSNFNSYGQLTLEQAVWFRDTPKYLNEYDNYRAFYPGPPSSTPDQYGRYLCTITGTPKPTSYTPPERRNRPVQGSPQDAGYPWGPPEKGMSTTDPVGDLITLGIAAVLAKGLTVALTAAAPVVIPRIIKVLTNLKPTPAPVPKPPVPKGPPTAARPVTPIKTYSATNYGNQPLFKPRPQPQPFKPSNPKPTRGMGDTYNPFSNSYQPKGELITEGLEELPIDLIPIIHNILVDMGGYTSENIDKLIKVIEKFKKPVKESKDVITESRKRIFRDIRKPYEIKEQPTKFRVKPKLRSNRSVGKDMMINPDIPREFKDTPNIWNKGNYKQNERQSQDRKNTVLEVLGAADHHWEYLLEKNHKKSKEKVNEKLSKKYDDEMKILYEKYKQREEKINRFLNAQKKN